MKPVEASQIPQTHASRSSRLFVLLRVDVDDPADHLLVRRAVLLRFLLEELDTRLAQRDRDLHVAFLQHEFIRRRQEVPDNLSFPNGFIGVFCFLFHNLLSGLTPALQ